MEKISGILRPNNRTRVTDVSTSQPVRPGAPTYGRPVGKVTTQSSMEVEDRVSMSPQGRNMAETEKLERLQDLNDKFNLKRAKEEANGQIVLSQKINDAAVTQDLVPERVQE